MDSASAADAALATRRAGLIDIVLGTFFLTVGAPARDIAAIRWRRGVRILVWWGIFSGMYGLQKLGQTPAPALDFCLVRLARAEARQT